jgi:hypothetical protein
MHQSLLYTTALHHCWSTCSQNIPCLLPLPHPTPRSFPFSADIGGYAGGGGGPEGQGFDHNIHSPHFLQLLTRWFQFGSVCPVFRSHGHRLPTLPAVSCDGGDSGGYNEIWHFKQPYRDAIASTMRFREQQREYIDSLYAAASATGAPVIRPLTYDFPDDGHSLEVDDQVHCMCSAGVCAVLVYVQCWCWRVCMLLVRCTLLVHIRCSLLVHVRGTLPCGPCHV